MMELLEGVTLAEKIYESKTNMSLEQIKSYGLQLIQGIKHLHENFIVHQDLKPQNLVLSGNHE